MELFILKFLDCILGTGKGILLNKSQGFWASVISAIGTLFSLIVLVKIVRVNSIYGMIIISFATFLGTYIPIVVAKKIEKEKVFVFNITPDTNENGKMFADLIRENNIPVLTYKGYGDTIEQVLCCKIFSQSREESKLIENMIPEDFKYHVIETKNSIAA